MGNFLPFANMQLHFDVPVVTIALRIQRILRKFQITSENKMKNNTQNSPITLFKSKHPEVKICRFYVHKVFYNPQNSTGHGLYFQPTCLLKCHISQSLHTKFVTNTILKICTLIKTYVLLLLQFRVFLLLRLTRLSPAGASGSVIHDPNLDPDVLIVTGSDIPVSFPQAETKAVAYKGKGLMNYIY